MPTVLVEIDGDDVTSCSLSGSFTRRLNRPSQAQIRLPIDCAVGDTGSKLKITIDGTIYFHGFILLRETQCDENFGYTIYNATDPMELWIWRPARDYDGVTPGNFVDPYFILDKVTGPQMVESMLLASENPLLIPGTAEGPLFLDLTNSFFATGGEDLTGIPVGWPMSIAEVVNLLTSTGEVDVVLIPIDDGTNMARVEVYNGDYGTNLAVPPSVVFEFATGERNVRAIRWNRDMSNLSNKVQYFFGPKETTRRYKANITGDDPCLPGNEGNPPPSGKTWPGGSLPGRPSFLAPGDLGFRIQDSRDTYGVRMDPQEFDVDVIYKEDNCPDGAPTLGCCTDPDPVRMLFRRNWQVESWIRAVPREIIHITPTRNTAIGTFDIGDLVGVEVGTAIHGGASGAQRIYEYTVSWEGPDSVLQLDELQTSPTHEGI